MTLSSKQVDDGKWIPLTYTPSLLGRLSLPIPKAKLMEYTLIAFRCSACIPFCFSFNFVRSTLASQAFNDCSADSLFSEPDITALMRVWKQRFSTHMECRDCTEIVEYNDLTRHFGSIAYTPLHKVMRPLSNVKFQRRCNGQCGDWVQLTQPSTPLTRQTKRAELGARPRADTATVSQGNGRTCRGISAHRACLSSQSSCDQLFMEYLIKNRVKRNNENSP